MVQGDGEPDMTRMYIQREWNTSILTILAVMLITGGSVVLISKVGGKTVGRKIRWLYGRDDNENQKENQ